VQHSAPLLGLWALDGHSLPGFRADIEMESELRGEMEMVAS